MNADTYVSPSVEGAVCKNLPASAVESVNGFSEKWVISPLKQPKIEGNENGGNS
jgi:hypothetical protein